MRAPSEAAVGYRCTTCEFQLWSPLATLSVSTLGLYDDDRFPGRCLLVLTDHYEHLDEVPDVLAASFLADVQRTARALRKGLAADRVNVAVLGNAEPHVHAHLVPRWPVKEPRPHKSPWDDPRRRGSLPSQDKLALARDIVGALVD